MEEFRKGMSWKILPKKQIKLLKTRLERYFKELKESPREESGMSPSMMDPDMTRTERHRQIEISIQVSAFMNGISDISFIVPCMHLTFKVTYCCGCYYCKNPDVEQHLARSWLCM